MAITITQPGGDIPPNGTILLVQLYAYRHSQIGIMDCHFQETSVTGSGGKLGDVALEVQTAIDGSFAALTDTDTTILGCKVSTVEISPPPLPGIATSDTTGTHGPPGLPGQDTGLITKTTDFTGRGFRGRVYVPFPATDYQDADDTPTAAYVAALDTFATFLFTTFTVIAGGTTMVMKPVLFNRVTHGVFDITGFVSRKRWATQRRRGNYGRVNAGIIT